MPCPTLPEDRLPRRSSDPPPQESRVNVRREQDALRGFIRSHGEFANKTRIVFSV
ncbi:hypothetical protein HYPBUDRAFT_152505, partial [Hyphopichia burtonii NRRL Y-1933]